MGWRIEYLRAIKPHWRRPFAFAADVAKASWRGGHRVGAVLFPIWFIGKTGKEAILDLMGRRKPDRD